MANYGTLKAAIEAAIRTNGQQLITGQSLQTQLVNMVTALGKFFQSYGGVVTSASTFTAGDENVLFFATEAGTYTDFGGAVLDGKTLHILYYDGSWHDADTLIPSGAAFEAALALAIKGSQSGIAEGIADTISAGTAQEFLQRQSGGDGVNCIKRIKGKTIAWNQMVKPYTTGSGTSNNVTYTYGADGITIVVGEGGASGNVSVFVSQVYVPFVTGHKVLLRWAPDFTPSSVGIKVGNPSWAWYTDTENLITVPSTSGTLVISVPSGTAAGTYKVKSVEYIDLTLLGLGDLTADQFRALYPAIYAYNPGVLKSNDAAALLTDGFNQWDEEWEQGSISINNGQNESATTRIRSKNYISVLPTTAYYLRQPSTGNNTIFYYDADYNFLTYDSITGSGAFTTPANCRYVRFRTATAYGGVYANDICINLSWSGYRNGEYEPYWQRVLALRLSELTGIPEGGTEADRVTMFPNGLGGAGSAFDSIFVENGVTKARGTMAEEVDLGNLAWYKSGNYFAVQAPSRVKPATGYTAIPNIICSKYSVESTYHIKEGNYDKSITISNETTPFILVQDSAYTDAATFKAAMAGVKLLAEAATPIVYTDLQYADGTPFTMPATILVDNYGTERIQAPEGATTPSAPFCCDSNYSIGVANLVKRLAALENAE